MAMQISTNVKVLIITTLFCMLWLGWCIGFMPTILPPAMLLVIQLSGACFGALFVVFAGFYLWGKRWGFLVTFCWSIIYLVVVTWGFSQPFSTQAAGRPDSFLYAPFCVVIAVFSYRAYRELKPRKTA